MNLAKNSKLCEHQDLWSSLNSLKGNLQRPKKESDLEYRGSNTDSKIFSTKSGSTKFDTNEGQMEALSNSSSIFFERKFVDFSGGFQKEYSKISRNELIISAEIPYNNITLASEENFQMPFSETQKDLIGAESFATLESYNVSYDNNNEDLSYSKAMEEGPSELHLKNEKENNVNSQSCCAYVKKLLLATRKVSNFP
jgi:hypothetical protein